jgi:ABC-type polysaccharide/polyol phosphate transport system ATPase subunit
MSSEEKSLVTHERLSHGIAPPSVEDVVIHVSGVSKCYQLYDKPQDRLRQSIYPRLQRILRREPKAYAREFWALRNVSFDIRRGETIGIIGRNGSGKSTLLQIICGTLAQTTGTVEVQGRIAALLELGSGFNFEFTGRENVFMNAALLGLSRKETEARFDDIVAFADIGKFIEQPVKTYSSGMFARLAFSCSIFVNPDILVIDEILAVGDAPFQAKCIKAFHRLRDRGCTILLVSHDAYMIRNFCQRALYLRNGECPGFGETGLIIDQYNLEVETAVRADNQASSEAGRSVASFSGSNLANQGWFRIVEIELLDKLLQVTSKVKTGDPITIRFRYISLSSEMPKVTFVINLYRHDGLYICGTTSLMDGILPVESPMKATVSVTFPDMRLLSGHYMWRVAINDERAFGVYAEANHVCTFQVVDDLQCVGLFNMDRSWAIEAQHI